eukprot:1146160-Rhodomonas_salina.1
MPQSPAQTPTAPKLPSHAAVRPERRRTERTRDNEAAESSSPIVDDDGCNDEPVEERPEVLRIETIEQLCQAPTHTQQDTGAGGGAGAGDDDDGGDGVGNDNNCDGAGDNNGDGAGDDADDGADGSVDAVEAGAVANDAVANDAVANDADVHDADADDEATPLHIITATVDDDGASTEARETKRRRFGEHCTHRAGFNQKVMLLDIIKPDQFGIHDAEVYRKFA